MDVVIAMAPSKIGRICQSFTSDGFYCPAAEAILDELRRQGQFNLVHEETGIKIDCMFLKTTAFSREEFARKQRRSLTESVEVNVARPEDVIIKKLEFFKMGGSRKHLEDIQAMLRVSHAEIDDTYLQRWLKQLGLEKEWQQVGG